MSLTISAVRASRPGELRQAGLDVADAVGALAAQECSHRAAVHGLRATWHGPASDAATRVAESTTERMAVVFAALTRLQSALRTGSDALTSERSAILYAVDRLDGQGWSVAPDGSVSVRPGSALATFAATSPVDAMRVRALATDHTAQLTELLSLFDVADRRLDRTLRDAISGVRFGDIPIASGDPPDSGEHGPAVPVDGDPVEVRDWWNALTPAERIRIVAEHPDQLGGLDGVPVSARSDANVRVMTRDVDRVERRAAVTGGTVDQLRANAERFGLTSAAVTRYDNALRVRSALAANSAKTGGVPAFLYVYEPETFGGEGRVAVAIGNPDEADNTTVVVPGVGNGVHTGWLSGDDAVNVYAETFAADPSRKLSVVAWMGYDAPDSLVDPQIAQPAQARHGGNLLANDVNALDVTNRGDSHVTVVGHSYGSTTVADACAGYDMRADDVVLIGSPGTDLARTADDFGLPPGGQVFVGAASTDPVTYLGVDTRGTDVGIALGADPAQADFGATRIKAEVTGLSTPWDDHSGYLALGGESLYGIAEIASGHADLLDDRGMIAGRRRTVALPGMPDLEFDPELFRPATGGHAH
ncbi:alpha/beta hydrolase [Mycolicibacterium lacusdiani]|uniref:alpha/beta hydrolase n=1 Tax=Mycolicibacterium lacusdiani TaxID=2895283 RepID=UPI001F1791A6|nr:alpha/beta hydrolase [Mycolicibacterium lacusdiani]